MVKRRYYRRCLWPSSGYLHSYRNRCKQLYWNRQHHANSAAHFHDHHRDAYQCELFGLSCWRNQYKHHWRHPWIHFSLEQWRNNPRHLRNSKWTLHFDGYRCQRMSGSLASSNFRPIQYGYGGYNCVPSQLFWRSRWVDRPYAFRWYARLCLRLGHGCYRTRHYQFGSRSVLRQCRRCFGLWNVFEFQCKPTFWPPHHQRHGL